MFLLFKKKVKPRIAAYATATDSVLHCSEISPLYQVNEWLRIVMGQIVKNFNTISIACRGVPWVCVSLHFYQQVILQNILVGALGPTSSLPFQIVNNKSLQMFNTYHPTMICELVGLKLVKIFINFFVILLDQQSGL